MNKSELTKQRIIDAAKVVIVREGFSAFTHRLIAKEAKVPLGSTTYHFADLDELMNKAVEAYIADETIRRQKVAPPKSSKPKEVAEYLFELLFPRPYRSKKSISRIYERLLQAQFHSALQKIIQQDQANLTEVISRALVDIEVKCDPMLMQAIFEGRVFQWLNSSHSKDWLIQTLAEDLSAVI
jgi:DNA-binding transcriptional regulator YbjK